MRALERVLDALLTEEGGVPPRRMTSSTSEEFTIGTSEQQRDGGGAGKVWKPVHWRLRHALASQAAFSDLWEALTAAAACCFEEGGRHRQAFICRSEVADCLAASGKFEEAAEMFEAQCRLAFHEGWTTLATIILPKLATCQAAISDPGLPLSTTAMLVLGTNQQNSTFSAKHTAAAFALLHRAAETSSPSLVHLRQPLLSPYRGPKFSTYNPQIDPEILDLSALLVAQPIKGSYSRFYRTNDHVGQPVLCATGLGAAERGRAGSHVRCAVGDVAVITIKVINNLPSSVILRDLHLSLAGMQEIMGKKIIV